MVPNLQERCEEEKIKRNMRDLEYTIAKQRLESKNKFYGGRKRALNKVALYDYTKGMFNHIK